jgi:3-deoxy-D-manno-octulosonate 8-phosphate phosphatase (KDO 8-P phosphatase)
VNEDVLQRARGVRLAIFDVDGVMTDGTVYFGARGEVMKAFNIQDGHGLKLLLKAGVRTAILSGRKSAAVARRMKELQVEHVIQGAGDDKVPAFEKLVKSMKLSGEQCSFMGDDIQDLPVMRRCGLAAAPSNGVSAVREAAHYVTTSHGGRGAVRELCDLIIRAQRK